MPIAKTLISAPLEAGQSLLDIKQLPRELIPALEYVSGRLARKRLHLSLIVVRKGIQLPNPSSAAPESQSSSLKGSQSSSPKNTPSPANSTTPSVSPSRSIFSAAATSFHRSPSSSSTHSSSNGSSNSESSTSSTASSPPSGPSTLNPWGITLIHAPLHPKALLNFHRLLQKASKKYPGSTLSPSWLRPPSTSHESQDLILRSLKQNEVLFRGTGIELLSLDHIYILKHHLHQYSTSLSPQDLSLAIDELQRCLITRNGRKITKVHLMHEYKWLGMSLSALAEVNEGYRNTYGGWKKDGGIDMSTERKIPPLNLPKINAHLPYPEPRRVRITYSSTPPDKDEGYESRSRTSSITSSKDTDLDTDKDKGLGYDSRRSRTTSISSESCLSFYAQSPSYLPPPLPSKYSSQPTSRTSSPLGKLLPAIKPLSSPSLLSTPSRQDLAKSLPLIKPLPTSLPKPTIAAATQPHPSPTQKPTSAPKQLKPAILSPKLDTSFLHMLNARPDKGPHFRGPMTPNGYEDITPVTKGEWCFLMVGEGWGGGRRAPVVTCG